MAVSLEKFVERLEASGLLPADEVSASIDALPEDRRPKDVKSLAKHLVNQGKLTKYQAAAVYQQQTDHLVLGDYVVLDKLGEGGMGQVLKAQHRRMDRIVALKILPAAKVDSKTAISRFHQEVRAAAKLTHPNIVTAYDAGDQDGVHYLVMEYVDGHDLSAVVKQQGQLPVEQAIDYIIQAAQGLGYAHDKGVVHRDIKPGNLLVAVSDQRSAIGSKSAICKSQTEIVKILDMGLARLTSGDLNKAGGEVEGLTQSGQVMGTVDYMAPEQALDTRRADHRADIYALGCTMYRLLTGEVPFAGDTMMMKLLAHREQPVPSLREFRPDVTPALDAVYQRMMAKEPEDRQQSMAEVVEQLQAALVSRAAPARARPAAPPAPARPAEQPPADSALASFLQTADKPATPTAKAAGTTAKKKKKGSATAFEETIDRSSSDEGTGDRLGNAQPLVSAASPAAESGTQPRPVSATTRDNKKPWLIPAIAGGGVLAVLLIGIGLYALLFSSNDKVRLADEQTPGVTNETPDDDAIPVPGSNRNDTGQTPLQGSGAQANVPAAGNSSSANGTSTPPPDYGPGAPPLAVAPFDEQQAKSHQQAWAEFLSLPVEKEVTLPGGEKMAFRLIPPGEFLMGSTDEDRAKFLEEAIAANDIHALPRIHSESPQHRVRITRPFYLGKYEVTQAQWESVMGGNPSRFKDNPTHPVEQVNWDDVQTFMNKLGNSSSADNMKFTLPTEAQWEYACRAGTTSPFYSGDRAEDAREIGWFSANSGGKTNPVGELRPNAFRLFDMSGNVWEWCADYYAAGYYAKSPVDDPTGPSDPSEGSGRVFRGGSCFVRPWNCRSAYRIYRTHPDDHLGFRLAMTIPDSVWRDKAPTAATGGNFSLQFEKEGFVNFADEAFGYDGTHPLTLECWLNLGGELSGWNGNFSLFGPGGNLALQVHPIGGTPRWHFYAGGGTNQRGFVNHAQPISEPIHKYVHIAMTYDSESVAFFLDGKLVREFPYEFARKIGLLRDYLIGLSWNPFDGVADTERPDFRVAYDAVRISRTARYDGDFTPQRTFTPDRDTIAIYEFNEGGGTVVNDSSGNGHHGTIHGAKWVRTAEPATSVATAGNITPADGWFEMLPLVDPKLDRVHVGNLTGGNDWKSNEHGLVFTPDGKPGKIVVPVSIVGNEYELRLSFTRRSGAGGFVIDVPDQVGVVPIRIFSIGQIGIGDERTSQDTFDFQTERQISIVVRVQRTADDDTIQVESNGNVIDSWTGPIESIVKDTRKEVDTTLMRTGLFVHGGGTSTLVFDSFRLRMLDGEATPLRVIDKAPTDTPLATVADQITATQGWVDVLPLADASRDVVEGNWQRGGDSLAVSAGDNAHSQLMLPVVPKGSYALEVEFTRTKGTDDVAVLLPVAGRRVVFHTSAFRRWAGINAIGGAGVHTSDNPTRQRTAVTTGQPIKLQIAVMQQPDDQVRFILVSGSNERVDVTVPLADLQEDDKWHANLSDKSRLGLGAHDADATIEYVKLKMLDGEAEVLAADRETIALPTDDGQADASQPPSDDTKDDGSWITLFNGRNLTGWEVVGDPKLWNVSNGAIVTDGQGKLAGWLSTDKQFSDFVLQLEFRLPPNGNSGVFLRAPREGPVNGGNFLEIALQDDATDSRGSNLTGSAYGLAERKVAGALFPASSGKWNQMEIRAAGSKIQVALNGRLINEFDLEQVRFPARLLENGRRPSGYIGLQCNRTGAAFRNIRIRSVE